VALIGPPHPDVEYLIASTCHQAVFDHLEGSKVTLWHVFDAKDDAIRTLPHGEWALTGGCSVGLRTMTIARFLGFTEQHIFGMDGNAGAERNHADVHPNGGKAAKRTEYPVGSGQYWNTTPAMLEAARGTMHELNQMPDVRPTFYGEGLVQTMMRDWVPDYEGETKGFIGFVKPELISAAYKALNSQLHHENLAYGVGGAKHAPEILKIAASIKTKNILDYGCGKGRLGLEIPWQIVEYDPCIPGKEASPKPADLVVCTDVLEHIEPERLVVVLADLQRCVRQVGYFVVHTGPAMKTLPDGRNTHLIQQDPQWWRTQLQRFFKVGLMRVNGPAVTFMVGVKQSKLLKQQAMS
jgi:2-polyprenyl-3-methyl-5-hydroxy-6-metoxy-1,4-benzoquinol methylase